MYKLSVDIKHLNLSDLDGITNVHMQAFPNSALSRIGSIAVTKYYEWQLMGPHDTVCLGAYSGEELVGFCFGGIFRGALGGFLEKNKKLLIRRVLIRPWLLFNPIFRDRAFFAIKRIFNFSPKPSSKHTPNSNANNQSGRAFGILSIAVSPSYQGAGVARLLMEHSETAASQQGFDSMRLTVHPTNLRAIVFYEKMGWQKNLIDDEWLGSMSKTLTK